MKLITHLYSAEVQNEWSYTSTPLVPSWHGLEKRYLFYKVFQI
jgi:hypothetical protein